MPWLPPRLRRLGPCLAPCLALAALLLAIMPALANSPRFGVHPNFDRVVIALPADEPYLMREAEGLVVVEAQAFGLVADSADSGARIRRVSGGQGRVTLGVADGARRRLWRSGDKLVVDVFDRAAKPPTAPPRDPGSIPASIPARSPSPARTAVAKGAAPTPAAGVLPQPAPVHVLVSAPVPLPLAPVRATPAAPALPEAATQAKAALGADAVVLRSMDGTYPFGSLFVQAGQEVGAAAFARGGAAHVVFDAPLPLDLGTLKDDPRYGGTSAQILPAAAHLRFKLPEGMGLRLAREPDGWRFGLVRQGGARAPIVASPEHGALRLAASLPSAALVLEDQTTGGRLLVGTQRGDGEHFVASRHSPEFELAATWLGVMAEAVSDRLALRVGLHGFILGMSTGPGLATAMQAGPAADASVMTRRFDFPDLPVPMLRNRLHEAMREEAAAPKLSRAEARLRTAQAMLSLGMEVEALAVLRAAAGDDPAWAARPQVAALSALSDWLSGRGGRPADGGEVVSPFLDGSDEGNFWQAAVRGDGPALTQSSATLAALWPLTVSYPEPLRRVLLPRIAQALLSGGQKAAALALLAASPAPALDLARAQLAQADGRVSEALDWFDSVARHGDRLASAQARRQAVELRLGQHSLGPREAATALMSQLYAWRGDDRELDLRVRAAGLLAESGNWRASLALLRESGGLFPNAHDRIHEAETALVAGLLKDDAAAKLAPLELVALVAECADLLSENPASSVLAPVLVDRLLALDLPERAEPIMVRMVRATASAAPKAELGLRLAELRLARGDPAGAGAALEETRGTGLDDGLVSRRAQFQSRLLASLGDKDAALRLLATLDAPEAAEQRATLLEQRHDWKAAMEALSPLIAKRIGSQDRLNDRQADLVLRFASDAAQAGDMAALRQLRDSVVPRFPAGSKADLLRVLTESPVQGTSDLPRAGEELVAARTLPVALGGAQVR